MKRMWSEEEIKEMIEQGGGGGSTDVTASDIDSEESTAGQVLTSNGEGGASWQDASGGGSTLYQHNIEMHDSIGKQHFSFISTSNTKLETIKDIVEFLLTKDVTTEIKSLIAIGGETPQNAANKYFNVFCVWGSYYESINRYSLNFGGYALGTSGSDISKTYDFRTKSSDSYTGTISDFIIAL